MYNIYMKKILLTSGILGIILFGGFSNIISNNQSVVYAQSNSNTDPTTGGSKSNTDPTSSAGKSFKLSFKIDNPIKATNLQELIERLLKLVYLVGVPVIVCFLLWAGFLFIEARGNDTKLTKARNNLLNVVIGTVLFLGAYTIAKVVIATIKDIFN